MQYWWWVKDFLVQNRALALACGLAVLLLVCAAFLVMKTGRSGIYLAFSAMAGGGFALFVRHSRTSLVLGVEALACLCVVGGVVYLLAVCGVSVRERRWARRAKRAQDGCRLQCDLPKGKNSFVQARIKDIVQAEQGTDGLPRIERIDVGYARSLLAQLNEKPLSVGEKLEVENMQRLLGAYLRKPCWSVDDVRVVNDLLSALMKLCAKYSVGCSVEE